MFKNYLKIALRSLFKNRTYTLINIFGLVIGIACTLMIFLYIEHQLSYDNYHAKKEQIYRCYTNLERPSGDIDAYATCPPAVGATIKKDYPEVELAVRLLNMKDMYVSLGDEQHYETIAHADSSLFEIFDFEVLSGNPTEALKNPNTLVLTESIAYKYFGKTQVLDEILTINDTLPYQVKAIIKDIPSNSSLRFEMVTALSNVQSLQSMAYNWWAFGYQQFFLMKENVDIEAFGDKIELYSRKYIPDQEDGSGYHHHLNLEKLSDIHLYSDKIAEWQANGKIAYIYIFAVIALFILAMACINYMNLATARSAKRAKEVGLRKVVGSTRGQLILQFIGESLLLVFFSVVLAVIVVEMLLPSYNQMIGLDLRFNYWSNPWLYLGLFGMALIIGLLAGSYPAFFLSSFKPVYTLKGNFSGSKSGKRLRQSLVVFQFVITIILMTSTLIVHNQLSFMRNKDLGFDQSQVLVIDTRRVASVMQKAAVLKNELLKSSDIKKVSLSSGLPGRGGTNGVVFRANEQGGDDIWTDLRILITDQDFVDLYGINIKKGRNFSAESAKDKQGVFLINEAAIEEFAFKDMDNALQKELGFRQNERLDILGITNDFHLRSLQMKVEPLVIYYEPEEELKSDYRYGKRFVSVAFNAQNTNSVLENLQKTWDKVMPNRPLEYAFLDQDFAKNYRQDEQVSYLFQIFAGMAIFIACLGLLGLSAYTAEQRTKEIGIRKVLGASLMSILSLVSSQFMRLVLIALVIAFPLAYTLMNYWLQDFAYRITINLFLFPLVGLLALLIAMGTVSIHALRVARVNPANVLKEE